MKNQTIVVMALGLLLSIGGTAEADLVVADNLLVSLDAQAMPEGVTSTWLNAGLLAGDFVAAGDPIVEVVDGVKAVVFDGDGDWFQGPNAPAGLVGLNPTRSIEVWTYNPDVLGEETLVSWGHRGGPAGTNMSFNYGTNASYGAVGHWGSPDIGWDVTPEAGQWHHLAYTYDGTTTRVYADGVEMNSEVLGAGVINTFAGDPIYLATQNPTPALLGSLSLAQVRIHDGVLSGNDVLNNFNEGPTAVYRTFDDLTWADGAGDGTWDSPTQWSGGQAGDFPGPDTEAMVQNHTISVSHADAAAFALTVNQGEVAIDAGRSLAVEKSADFAEGSTLTLGDGATFSAGGGSIPTVATAEDPTLNVSFGGGVLSVGNLTVGSGTLTKQGPGTLSLDNSSGTGVDLPATAVVRIEAGTLSSKGIAPLGEVTSLTLAGGTFSFASTDPGTPGPGPAGAVAHWAFDEAGGTVAADTSAAASVYDGAVMGGAVFTPDGKLDGALEFDGVDDWVDLPDGFEDFSRGFSFAVWAQPTALMNWGRIIDFGNGTAIDNILYGNRGTSNNVRFEVHDGIGGGNQIFDLDGVWDVNAWQHFAGTIDADGNAVLYKNGEPIGTSNMPLPGSVVRTENFIGESNWAADASYQGLMDELYIYDRALTAAEVEAMAGLRSHPDVSNIDVLVSADSTLDARTTRPVAFGSLTLEAGVLTTTGQAEGISFTGTTIAADATSVGFAPNLPTDYGVIDGNMATVSVIKAGPSDLVLDGANVGLANATFETQEGTLTIANQAAMGGSHSVRLSGGTLEILGEAGGPTVGPAGAVAHWAFDEADGATIAADTSGSPTVYDGQVMGGATFSAEGQIDGALVFDGVDDYVDLPDGMADFSSGFSFAVWANPAALMTWGRIIDFGNGAGDNNILYGNRGTSDDVRLEVWNGVGSGAMTFDLNDVWELNEWQHFAGTIDADGTARLYKNGEVLATRTMPLPANVVRTNNFIGESNWGADASFRGMMDEMYIYDRALTEVEVAAMAGLAALGDLSHIDVTVTADSTLRLPSTAAVDIGPLTLHTGIVTTTGAMGGITFAGTTVDAADGAVVGVDLQVETQLGPISVANATPVTIVKAGPADMVLTAANVGATGLGSNVTFEAREGRLVGLYDTNPFDQAGLRLRGGELLLSAEEGADPVVYDNPLAVEEDGTLTAGAGGVGAAGPRTVTLGSAANGLALNGGKLTVQATDDYALDLAGPLSGPGELIVAEGNVTLSGGGSVDSLRVSGGTLNAGADVNVASMRLTAGTVNTGANNLIVSQKLTVQQTTFSVDAGNTFQVNGSDLLSGGDVTLGGGRLSISGGSGAGLIIADELLVDVDAQDLPDGPIDAWSNNGALGEVFELMGGSPQVETVTDLNGISAKAVNFDGSTYFDGPISVESIEGAGLRSIEVWAHNPDLTDEGGNMEETMIAWGHRGGPVGTNMGFNYSDHDSWGAVTHWGGGTHDMGWNGQEPEPEQWHHLVYTFDGETARLYSDGVELVSKTFPPALSNLNTHAGDPIRLGAQNASAGGGDPAHFASMDIAAIRVHDGVLEPDDVLVNFQAGIAVDATAGMLDLPGTNLTVTADSVLELLTNQEPTLGDLTLEAGVALEIDGPGINVNDATVGAGSSIAGALLLRGTLTMDSGTFSVDELEFDGEDSGFASNLAGEGNGMVEVGADAFLGGTLTLRATDTLGSWTDHTRTIMQAIGDEAELLGEFDFVPAAGDHLGRGVFHKDVIYTMDTEVQVTVFQAAPGDADGNREINNADLQAILGAGSFGSPGQWDWPQGDFNGDGAVNNSDLQLILATGLFGTGSYAAVAPGGGLAVVPEPGTLLLLAAGLLGLLLWRRGRRAV